MLKGKVVIVTGASRGIGKCIAETMVKNGATVYANARKEGSIDVWAQELSGCCEGNAVPLYCDLNDSETVKGAIQKIWKEHGKIDVLVNNAGVEYNESIGMIRKEHMEEMFRTNIISLIEVTQLVGRMMMKSKNGSIINISSIVATYGSSGQSVYAATKGAINAFTKSAAKELGKYNIRVNAIAPGITETEMATAVGEQFLNKRLEKISLGRMAQPADIANMTVYLASDQSNYISGQVIGIDGAGIV